MNTTKEYTLIQKNCDKIQHLWLDALQVAYCLEEKETLVLLEGHCEKAKKSYTSEEIICEIIRRKEEISCKSVITGNGTYYEILSPEQKQNAYHILITLHEANIFLYCVNNLSQEFQKNFLKLDIRDALEIALKLK